MSHVLTRIVRAFALLVTFCFIGLSPAKAYEELVFSTFEDTVVGDIGAKIVTAAYRKLGIDLQVYRTSSKRSLMLSSKGAVDGEVVRIFAVGDRFPDLIRIKMPTYVLTAAVYVQESRLGEITLENLPTMRVGYLAGVVQAERYTEKFEKVWKAQSNEELFGLLAKGKIDAVVSNSFGSTMAIGKLGLTDIVAIDPPIEVTEFYHYLHKRHERIAPQVRQVLAEMGETGETRSIIYRHLNVMVAGISEK